MFQPPVVTAMLSLSCMADKTQFAGIGCEPLMTLVYKAAAACLQRCCLSHCLQLSCLPMAAACPTCWLLHSTVYHQQDGCHSTHFVRLAGGCRVLRAFPVEELVTEDDTINAEMDPEDVFRVTEHIQGHHQMTSAPPRPPAPLLCMPPPSLAPCSIPTHAVSPPPHPSPLVPTLATVVAEKHRPWLSQMVCGTSCCNIGGHDRVNVIAPIVASSDTKHKSHDAFAMHHSLWRQFVCCTKKQTSPHQPVQQ